MRRLIFLLPFIPLLLSSCVAHPPPVNVPPSGTPSAVFTLAPTASPTQTLTSTPLPATATATPILVEGTLTIKVNVRSGPGTSFATLGLLNAGEKVRIIYRDATSTWYQILFPAVSDGIGWVAAQFVQVAAGTQVPLLATPTPAGPTGRLMQRLNVRSGPGLTFDSLGVLEPDTVVALTGKNSTASWLQIDYPAGPGGRGWVTAQYVQTDAAGLPVLDDYGTPVASGTLGPTVVPVTPTSTVGPAYADNDSPANPAIRVTFSSPGTRQFTYASQLSAPTGDPEDWIEFTPYAIKPAPARLVFGLACSGNATLTVEIWQGGNLLPGWGSLACGDSGKKITLPVGLPYELRLLPAAGQGLRLVDYVLTVQNLP